jgi:hypothetical protein
MQRLYVVQKTYGFKAKNGYARAIFPTREGEILLYYTNRPEISRYNI